jgi:hypothetical protein
MLLRAILIDELTPKAKKLLVPAISGAKAFS